MNKTEKNPSVLPESVFVVEGIRGVFQNGQGSGGNKAESVKDRGWEGPSEEVTFDQRPEQREEAGVQMSRGTVIQMQRLGDGNQDVFGDRLGQCGWRMGSGGGRVQGEPGRVGTGP